MDDLAVRLQAALGAEYRVERELPLGGLGRLFLAGARGGGGGQVVAQVLPPDIAERLDTARFVAGVEDASRLRHPGIQPVLAAGAAGGLVWCLTPRPAGESVRSRIQREGGLDRDEVVQVLHDAADALAYGHTHGVGHGDLKPDNIHLVGGRAVLAEYGLRAALSAALEGDATPDERADVYALAMAGRQMLGASDAPVAAAIARALSIDPAEQYASAAALRDAVGTPPSARRLRARRRVVAGTLVFALLGALVIQQIRSTPPLDPDAVAVAPFEVLDPGHELWREGLVTVLSANLDGAGPLRTVSPTLIVRRWEGSADAQSATRLAELTGAGLVVFGRVVRVGGDSVRLTATMVDAAAERPVAEAQVTGVESRIDVLADSLTVQLLGQLARTRPLGAVRRASLGSGSVPAIKAFLLGEQSYRRSEWDSALVHYQRAIELDSTFALALYRAGIVLGWQSSASDSLSTNYLIRAAERNRGLPARESMLVVAESLSAAIEEGVDADPQYWRNYRRLYATVDAATRRYPRDPEVWYERGEVRYHYPEFSTLAETRTAFDHAILLDSAFAPAYIHPIELSLRLGEGAAALRYLDGYMALRPRDTYAGAARLTRDLLDPRRAGDVELQALLDTASADVLVAAMQSFRGWPDTLETWLHLIRLVARGDRPAAQSLYRDSIFHIAEEVNAQLWFGHLRAAYARLGQRGAAFYAPLAWLGGVPAESAAAFFGRSLRQAPLYPQAAAVVGAPWFAQQRDTTSLRELARRADSLAQTSRLPRQRAFGRYVADGARALTDLANGDTAAAALALAALPDTACVRCTLWQYVRVEALLAAGMDSAAGERLRRDPPGFIYPLDPLWRLYRARLALRRGDRATARAQYRLVRDAWARGDSVLRPYVREANAALQQR